MKRFALVGVGMVAGFGVALGVVVGGHKAPMM